MSSIPFQHDCEIYGGVGEVEMVGGTCKELRVRIGSCRALPSPPVDWPILALTQKVLKLNSWRYHPRVRGSSDLSARLPMP